MTPKEKAVRLVDRYLDEVINEVDENYPLELPKRLAIIAVDEIIDVLVDLSYGEFTFINDVVYWNEVKHEINNL